MPIPKSLTNKPKKSKKAINSIDKIIAANEAFITFATDLKDNYDLSEHDNMNAGQLQLHLNSMNQFFNGMKKN